jgi:cytidylate kinase
VQAMWQKITNPDILIYLDASFPVSTARRRLNWQKEDHAEQLRRLAHARQHAHLVIETDNLTPSQVLQKVLDYLKEVNP